MAVSQKKPASNPETASGPQGSPPDASWLAVKTTKAAKVIIGEQMLAVNSPLAG